MIDWLYWHQWFDPILVLVAILAACAVLGQYLSRHGGK